MFKYSTFQQIIHFLKLRLILGLLFPVLYGCNKAIDTESDVIKKDTSKTESPELKPEPIIPIDSIKMHAIDNLYFGANTGTVLRKFEVDNIEYVVKVSKGSPVYYYMLESNSTITTKKKANSVLNDLKKIIALKYNNPIVLNQTKYTKHPEEREKNRSVFEQRSFGEFDEKIIGQPYEFAGYKWNLKYKTIQIGYFIENKNRTRYMEAKPNDDYYNIYIELTSKFNNPKAEDKSKEQLEKDSKKF